MTKPEFEWIPFNGGEAYVPKGKGVKERVAWINNAGKTYLAKWVITEDLSKREVEMLFSRIASALSTPAPDAPDALPEGWKATTAKRADGTWISLSGWWMLWGAPGGNHTLGPATMTLAEACRAADERFPVVKPEAPAKWVQNNQWCWQRSADRSLVHRMSDIVGLWGFIFKGETLAAFPTAEEAMAWADRERPVA